MPVDVGPSRKHLSTLCSWEQALLQAHNTVSGQEGRARTRPLCVCVCVVDVPQSVFRLASLPPAQRARVTL